VWQIAGKIPWPARLLGSGCSRGLVSREFPSNRVELVRQVRGLFARFVGRARRGPHGRVGPAHGFPKPAGRVACRAGRSGLRGAHGAGYYPPKRLVEERRVLDP